MNRQVRTLSPWSRHSWGFAGSTGCSWRPGWQDEAATPRPGSEDSSRGENKGQVTRRVETTPERLGLMSPTRSWETGEESAAARSQEQLLEPDLAQQSLVPKQILILRAWGKGSGPVAPIAPHMRQRWCPWSTSGTSGT